MSDQTITPPECDGYQYASLPLSFDVPRGLASAAEKGWEFLAIDPSPRVPRDFGGHQFNTGSDGQLVHKSGPAEPFGLFRRDLSKWSTTGQRKLGTRFVTSSSSTLTTSLPMIEVTREEPEVRVLRLIPVVNQCADTDGDGDCHLCAYHTGFVCPKNVRAVCVWQWKPHPFDAWVDVTGRQFPSMASAYESPPNIPAGIDFRLVVRTILDKVANINRAPRRPPGAIGS